MVKELIPADIPFWDRMEIRDLLRPASTIMPGEMWQIKINETKMIGRLDDVLYEHCHKDEIIQYWISKGRITEEGALMVDWESHHKAMKAFGPRKHWVTKHFSSTPRSVLQTTRIAPLRSGAVGEEELVGRSLR